MTSGSGNTPLDSTIHGATPRPRPSRTSSDEGPISDPEIVELSTDQEEDESFDCTRRGTSEYPARARQSPSTAQEEELPDLTIETEPPEPDNHDDPPEYYRFVSREQESIMELIRSTFSGGVVREYKPCFCQDHVCREETRYAAMDRATYRRARNTQFNLCSCSDEEHSCSYTET